MRLAVATRSMNDFLYDASGELLGLDCPRYRLAGTDNFGYFRELLHIDADWVISIDEDAFVLDPARLRGLVRVLEEGGYAACGMPDGGVVPIRRHNPAACNAFFNVFDLRRVRRVWQDWDHVRSATHHRAYEKLASSFARRTTFAFDHFEHYYGAFFSLLDAGERLLYLDAEEWRDGVSTLLKDAAGDPLLLHCWYTRHWSTSYHTRRRYQAVIDHARESQGLEPYSWGPDGIGKEAAAKSRAQPPLIADRLPSDPVRRAVLDCIPRSARRAAVVGSNADDLAQAVRAARKAEIFVVNYEEMQSLAVDQKLDCIVCQEGFADLRDPELWLRRARSWLREGGSLILAFPNVRHHDVVDGLLQGRWQRGSNGPARRPLRFFTRREIEKLCYRAGFSVGRLEAVPGAEHAAWHQRGRPPEVKVGDLHLRGLAPDDAEEFYTSNFVAQAVAAAPPSYGLTSIVIVTHNELPYTRLCLESIRQYTDEPYELILVDNGSSDGTPQFLGRHTGAKVIRNEDNRGFPAAVNQGLRVASGSQFLLLNNDTIVTTGWLGRLLQALHSDEQIGLVGPCSNYVSGAQLVEVNYDDLAQVDGFAWDWGKAHQGAREDSDRLVGFCLLVRRELIDRIGLLDERFGVGCFEDDDFCRRALRAGYRAVIARDAFVHHFGSRTFAGSGADFAAIMRRNESLFREKWEQEDQRPEATPAAPAAAPAPRQRAYQLRAGAGGGLLLGYAGVELSLCMIVRDNARTIDPCLESIRPVVDDMVVIDTGSRDETPAIARRLGARVYEFPWCDSFSAARNESLRHARGRWVFWMDSDDIIDAANARMLREIITRDADPRIMGYVVSVHCPGPGEDADVTVVQHVKLFRNFPQLRFEGRIHEQIIPAIRALGGDIAWTDLFVVHSGYDHSPEGQKRKLERDLRLLHLELEERPDHPFTLFNLAMTYTDTGRFSEGVGYARRSIAVSPDGASHLRKAYAYLVHSHDRLGQPGAAWQACLEGLGKFPLDDELRFRKGVLLHARGELQKAAETYLDLLRTREEAHFSSVVAGIAGHLARHNLALVYGEMGELAQEEEQWRLIVNERPHYRPAWRGLGDVLVRQGKLAEAQTLGDRLVSDKRLSGEGQLLASALAASRGDWGAARRDLERAVKEDPEDVGLLEALCRMLFEHAPLAETEQALRELVRRSPDNPSGWHNLGTVCLRLHQPEVAVAAYRESLRYRPDAAETHLHLGYALKQIGRMDEAIAAWKTAVRLDPGNPFASEELRQARAAQQG